MSSLAKLRFSPEEYLDQERQAQHRSEYYSGEIFAMAGASQRHNLIASNMVRELSTQFRGRPCQTYASDMRVKVSVTGLYTYPDVVAVCGDIQFEDEDRDTLLNPVIVVEVLSKSTEAYDRGEKFAHYRRLESVTDYLLVSQDKVRVEHYTRQTDGQWLLAEISDLAGLVTLPAIECELRMADIYEKVEFPTRDAPLSLRGAF
jgi:Uma2 family endonuclease